jgi:hypothetical protein
LTPEFPGRFQDITHGKGISMTSLSKVINCLPVEEWRDALKLIHRHHGDKGTVQILKQAKAWALQIVSGNKNFSLPWFRCERYREYKIPSRLRVLFCPLVKYVQGNDFAKIRLLLSALNVFQVIMGPLDDPEKVKEPVYSSPVESPNPFWGELMKLALYYVRARINFPPGKEIRPTGQAVAITPHVVGSYSQWVGNHAPGSELDERLIALNYLRFGEGEYEPLRWQGNLSIIGDRGGKSRLILVGTPWAQSRLEPLQKFLLSVLSSCPTDCTFNQEAGITFIRESMARGKKLHSVDLKDATWHFPMSLQAQVLEALGGSQFLPFFRLPVSDSGRLIEVKKGQAMGLMPSFPLFGLTHNLVLIAICKWLGLIPTQTFRVLGDDVIINSEVVKNKYLEFCKDYDLPISTHKCLDSYSTAEFAGKVIHKGYDVTPIRWRNLGSEQLSSLFYPYRTVLKNAVYSLIDKEAFLVLGGLPRRLGGLGITGFDQAQPVTTRHLRLRLGQVRSRLDNLGLPPMRGYKPYVDCVLGDNPPTILTLLDTYLRALSSYASRPLVRTKYGFLPYLGNPGRVARQLSVDIPLMPSYRKSSVKWYERMEIYYGRYYHNKSDRSRKDHRQHLRELYSEYVEQEAKLLAEKTKTPIEIARDEEIKVLIRNFVPTLFYE